MKNSLISIEKLKQENKDLLSEREEFIRSTLLIEKEKFENEILVKSNELIE